MPDGVGREDKGGGAVMAKVYCKNCARLKETYSKYSIGHYYCHIPRERDAWLEKEYGFEADPAIQNMNNDCPYFKSIEQIQHGT